MSKNPNAPGNHGKGETRRSALKKLFLLPPVLAALLSGNEAEARPYARRAAEAERDVEWTEAELERMGNACEILSSHRINPSFWNYCKMMGIEADVKNAIDLALANPALMRYGEDGMIEVRNPGNAVSVPVWLKIRVAGEGVDSRITGVQTDKGFYDNFVYQSWAGLWQGVRKDTEDSTDILAGVMRAPRMQGAYETFMDMTQYQLPHLVLERILGAMKSGHNVAATENTGNPAFLEFMVAATDQPQSYRESLEKSRLVTTVDAPEKLQVVISASYPDIILFQTLYSNPDDTTNVRTIAAVSLKGQLLKETGKHTEKLLIASMTEIGRIEEVEMTVPAYGLSEDQELSALVQSKYKHLVGR